MQRIIYIVTLLFTTALLAQKPTHVPSPQNNTPIDLNNWFDVTVFIILPLVMVFLYFLWRHQVKMDKDAENKKDKS